MYNLFGEPKARSNAALIGAGGFIALSPLVLSNDLYIKILSICYAFGALATGYSISKTEFGQASVKDTVAFPKARSNATLIEIVGLIALIPLISFDNHYVKMLSAYFGFTTLATGFLISKTEFGQASAKDTVVHSFNKHFINNTTAENSV